MPAETPAPATQQMGDGQAVALRLYAQVAADQQQWGPCAQAAVQLLSKVPRDREGARLLAQAVQEPAGMEALFSAVLPSNYSSLQQHLQAPQPAAAAASAHALVYLAQTLLSQGAVQQAVQLCRTAVQLNPSSSGCALGLAQVLEVQCDYAGVLHVLLGFCSANPRLQLGRLALQAVLQLDGLQQLSKHPYELGGLDWLQLQQPESSSNCPQHKELQPPQPPPPQQQQQPSPQQQQQQPTTQQHLQQQPQSQQAEAGSSAQTAFNWEALALLLTAARVLFCTGALHILKHLLQLSAAAEQAAAELQPLHLSRIRNEAAYSALMRQLLLNAPPPAAAAGVSNKGGQQQEVLYVCGDSHVLSLAWRVLDLHGVQHLLVPLLVPGCKAWHLRPGSTHPCSQHFKAAVSAVPRGGKLLLLLGEIDCREGLLLAVEKMKYASLDEAAAATAGVYVSASQQLMQQQELQVWVHSVPPVLLETRDVVQLFNGALKQCIQQSSHPLSVVEGVMKQCTQQSQPPLSAVSPPSEGTQQSAPPLSAAEGAGRLRFVDLERVLQQDARCMQLDGTHLHPCYIEHLQAAM